jgi:hypothetical protein
MMHKRTKKIQSQRHDNPLWNMDMVIPLESILVEFAHG